MRTEMRVNIHNYNIIIIIIIIRKGINLTRYGIGVVCFPSQKLSSDSEWGRLASLIQDTHLWAQSGTTSSTNHQNMDKRGDRAPIYSTKHYSAISANPQGNEKVRQLSMPYEEFVRRMVRSINMTDHLITSKCAQKRCKGNNLVGK
jgi:hypothetical protein